MRARPCTDTPTQMQATTFHPNPTHLPSHRRRARKAARSMIVHLLSHANPGRRIHRAITMPPSRLITVDGAGECALPLPNERDRNGMRSKRATHRVSDPRHVCTSTVVCESPCVVHVAAAEGGLAVEGWRCCELAACGGHSGAHGLLPCLCVCVRHPTVHS